MITNDQLIELLRARSIAILEWSVFFNNDEADFGPGMYRFTDGRAERFEYGTAHDGIDEKLWSIAFDLWAGEWEGLFALNVAERCISRTAIVYTDLDLANAQGYREEFPDAPPGPQPTERLYGDSDLWLSPLPLDEQRTVALDDLPDL